MDNAHTSHHPKGKNCQKKNTVIAEIQQQTPSTDMEKQQLHWTPSPSGWPPHCYWIRPHNKLLEAQRITTTSHDSPGEEGSNNVTLGSKLLNPAHRKKKVLWSLKPKFTLTVFAWFVHLWNSAGGPPHNPAEEEDWAIREEGIPLRLTFNSIKSNTAENLASLHSHSLLIGELWAVISSLSLFSSLFCVSLCVSSHKVFRPFQNHTHNETVPPVYRKPLTTSYSTVLSRTDTV